MKKVHAKICIGIFVGVSKLNNNLLKNDNVQLGEAESEENNLDVVLNINKLKEFLLQEYR